MGQCCCCIELLERANLNIIVITSRIIQLIDSKYIIKYKQNPLEDVAQVDRVDYNAALHI